jgi:two-component sensor histidine kinase
LAGIVGLLSMSANMEMPANVRQWLDRVIERIGNIARAHELFAGGVQTVSLQQLVEQVMPSLAVVKPPGVVIVKDLGTSEIWLKTTQAVSLAMVIHELCYNAIVHGLGARGTLTIRAQISENRNVIFEIIDDGTAGTVMYDDDGGIATMAPPTISTGMGLRLVKGLVGRELRGRFTMRRRNEGGTVVAVEFPLERDREESENRR